MKSQKPLALITGAAKRLGREIALKLAQKGYEIIITYNKSQDFAKELQKIINEKYNSNCYIYQCNLINIEETQKLAEKITNNHENWQILVNNASIFSQDNFLDDDFLQKFQKNQNLHLVSPIILSHTLGNNIIKNNLDRGHIINMIDKNITRYDTQYFYYLLSKKNLAELTKMLAIELAPSLRVNAIAPGAIIEPIDNKNFDLTNNPLEMKASEDNIISAVNYLLENDFVNGQILYVDGGANLNNQG